jgi:hypothetical protein
MISRIILYIIFKINKFTDLKTNKESNGSLNTILKALYCFLSAYPEATSNIITTIKPPMAAMATISMLTSLWHWGILYSMTTKITASAAKLNGYQKNGSKNVTIKAP